MIIRPSISSNFCFDYRSVVEWRISKRVEEQYNAFIIGFHELIPRELVNVFDERELEVIVFI
jgi:hypothetical protein